MGPGTGNRGRAPARPPPPVRQHNSLDNGCATCPYKPGGECTLKVLKIEATVQDAPSAPGAPTPAPKVRTLQTDRIKRNTQTGIRNAEIRGLLARYDFVIDVITEAISRENPAPKGSVTLQAKVTHTGKCEVQKHPQIFEIPLDEAPELPAGGNYYESSQTNKVKLQARRIVWDTTAATTPIGFIASLLDQMTGRPKRIDYKAHGCGARGMLWGRQADVIFNGLVRIYRKDSYSLRIAFAPYAANSASRSTTASPAGVTRTTTSSSVRGGTTTTSTTARSASGTTQTQSVQTRNLSATETTSRSVETGPKGTTISGSTRNIPTGQNQEFRRTPDGLPPKQEPGTAPWQRLGDGWARPSSAATPQPRVDLVLKRNGQELRLLEECRKFLEGLARIREIILRFGELLKKAPQAGFSFGYTLSFLEGSLEASMEPIHLDTPVEQRHLGIGYKGKLKAEIVFLTFSATASFGVKFDMGWLASAEATLSGTFKTDIRLGGEMTIQSGGSVSGEVMFRPTVSASIGGVLRASAAGVSLVDVRVTLEGGLTIFDRPTRKAGGIGWKSGVGFCFTGDLCTTDIVLKFTATSVGGSREPYEYILLGPQLLWQLAPRASPSA